MALKNQNNPYNFKLLSGYGISIKQKDNQIILNHKPDPFLEYDTEEWFVTNILYKKLVISGNGYITFNALKLLVTYNRNIILTDTSGKPVCLMTGLRDTLLQQSIELLNMILSEMNQKESILQIKLFVQRFNQTKFLESVNRKMD